MSHVFFTTEDTEKKEYTEFWLSVSHARSPRAADVNETPLQR